MLSTSTTLNLHKCIIEDSVTHVGHIISWKTLVCSCPIQELVFYLRTLFSLLYLKHEVIKQGQ